MTKILINLVNKLYCIKTKFSRKLICKVEQYTFKMMWTTYHRGTIMITQLWELKGYGVFTYVNT